MLSDIRLPRQGACVLSWFALVIAIVGLTGSLILSMGMGLKACPLCFYQRTFVMSLVAVLAIGLALGVRDVAFLALPLAMAGMGVASFHVYLESTGTLECPTGVLGLGSAPKQSLAVYVVLFSVLLLDGVLSARPIRWIVIASGLALGAGLAIASCVSNPPMPSPPTTRYPGEPEICRSPFRG